jgi:hypothetical protein
MKPQKAKRVPKPKISEFARAVGIALRQSARDARKVARMHGTPIYISRNGKVVAVKP